MKEHPPLPVQKFVSFLSRRALVLPTPKFNNLQEVQQPYMHGSAEDGDEEEISMLRQSGPA